MTKTRTSLAWIILFAILLTGCATPEYRYGKTLNKIPNTCLLQAREYAKYLSKEGKTVKLMVVGHAFCVMDGKIYDSTRMNFTGFSTTNWQVREIYGDEDGWRCIGIWGEGD